MPGLKKFLGLSKRLATYILKGEDQKGIDLKSEFNQEDEAYILHNLTDPDKIRERRELRKVFEQQKELRYRRITGEKNTLRVRLRPVLKLAAVFLGVIGLAYFIYTNSTQNNSKNSNIEVNGITLRLEDGSSVNVNSLDSMETLYGNGEVAVKLQNGRLIYDDKAGIEELIYNELIIPKGERYGVRLSDGTRVTLNAGSSLKYPVNFIKGRTREVYLDGEAFFQVTKDSIHPFSVVSNGIAVKVLGTKFNFSSYPENSEISAVLTEGSIQLYKVEEPVKSSLLKPGQMASWNRKEENITISEVDVSLYTGWMDGELIFKSTSFKTILERLERSYNVEIINNDHTLNAEIFTASFHIDIEGVTDVLDYLKLERPFTYSIDDNKIIINP
ncbi:MULTISPECIES: FecR family protein [Arenibacter]|uniref:FecR family protein n=1 Tax=Arenibacter TaxID=178469 RepID=UPI000A3CAA12|nr:MULTISPECIES: FecR family protein [Arenibacter]